MQQDTVSVTAESAGPAEPPQWDVADRMRKALRSADIGLQEIADYLGVSRHSAGRWINGGITPSTQTLRLWALRCGVTYEWLVSGDCEPQP
jgi:transcriptional regulator with XRE-family HTH domain